MQTIIKITGRVLQIMGLATTLFVIIIFFGKTDMFVLLKMTLIGMAEFYGGSLLLKWKN